MTENRAVSVWKRSLTAGCIVFVVLYALSYTGFSKLFGLPWYFIGMNDSPAAIIALTFLHTNWWWVACEAGIALLIYFIAGWRATRRTGQMKTGILVGLCSGLFFGTISILTEIAQILWSIATMPLSKDTLSGTYASALGQTDPRTSLITMDFISSISGIVINLLLIGLLTGIVAGVFGSIVGSSGGTRIDTTTVR